jgi:hypothetical protein
MNKQKYNKVIQCTEHLVALDEADKLPFHLVSQLACTVNDRVTEFTQ